MGDHPNWNSESPEVFYSNEPLVLLGAPEIDWLKRKAAATPRKRSRLCAHAGKNDTLHEMLIVHHRDVYVRPHRHLGRSESLHVLEGEAQLVLFHEDGSVDRVVAVGTAPGLTAYCRIPPRTFHTLLFQTEWFVFHEVIAGPFDPSCSEFAPWAPPDGDQAPAYQSTLRADLHAPGVS